MPSTFYPSKSAFTRWYDQSPYLSAAVKALYGQSDSFQLLMCRQIIEEAQIVGYNPKRHPGLKQLGPEKITAFLKSKVKRRWYDEDPLIHQAFNAIFLMEIPYREEIGMKILFTIEKFTESALLKTFPESGFSHIQSIFRYSRETLQTLLPTPTSYAIQTALHSNTTVLPTLPHYTEPAKSIISQEISANNLRLSQASQAVNPNVPVKTTKDRLVKPSNGRKFIPVVAEETFSMGQFFETTKSGVRITGRNL